MTVFVTIETGEVTQVLASRTIYVERMDTDGWSGIFPVLLVI